MRQAVRLLGLAAILSAELACNETGVVLAIHSDLLIPSQLDAICLQVVAGGAWEFGRRYPLAEEDAGAARTLSVLAGEQYADRFEVLLRGERRGWPVSFERLDFQFREREVVTEHLYLPVCKSGRIKAGTGSFPTTRANGTLANGATAVAVVPVAFAPSQMMAVSTDASRFAWLLNEKGETLVMRRKEGMPKLAGDVSRLLVVDVDNDCDLDLVALTASGPRVWRHLDGGVFEDLPNAFFLTEAFSTGAVADFNRDGYQDLVLVSATAVKLLLNDAGSPGRFLDSPSSVQGVSGGGIAVAVGLLDADANPDLVLVRGGSTPSLVLASNPGDATTAPRLTVSAIGLSDKGTQAVVIADLDADGMHDLALGSSTGPSTVLLNTKADPGKFVSVELPGTAASDVRELHAADLNNDCRRDLVLGTTGATRVLLNTGRGGVFSDAGSLDPPPPKPTSQIYSADIDGDGLLDLLMLGGGVATYHLQQAPGS